MLSFIWRKMMILITGATGFVGSKLMKSLKDTVAAPSLRNVSADDVKRIVEASGADTIIHTAAIADMGICEADPEASYFANVQIPIYLAKAAKGRKLICFSSDQVYSGCDGEGSYSEENVKPANVYASHKVEMEQRVLDIDPTAVMLRAEWMYDAGSKKGNYFTILNEEKSVYFSSGEYRGITYLKEVAENMEKVISLPGGAYNYGSETKQSMYEITKEYINILNREVELHDRPADYNLWMNCDKARKYGIEFSDALEGVVRCAKDCGIIKS